MFFGGKSKVSPNSAGSNGVNIENNNISVISNRWNNTSTRPTGLDVALSKKLEVKDLEHQDEEKKKTISEEFKELIKDCGGRSSVHGFPSLSEPSVYLTAKLVWVICCLTSWSYFIYQIYNIVNTYNAYEVVSSVSVGYEVPSNFPTVDLCNLNPYDGNVASGLMTDVLDGQSITPEDYDSFRKYTDQANKVFKSSFEYSYITNSSYFDIIYLGFLLNQMLVSCEFEGKTCNTSDFYLYHDYNYGNCFRFNGGSDLSSQSYSYHNFTPYDVKKSTKTGWRNGLRLELYTGNQLVQQQFTFKTGFRIIIHNKSIVTFSDKDGIDVAAGSQTNIAVTRTFMYRLGAPYSNCIDDLTQEVANQNDMLALMYEKKNAKKLSQYQQDYCLKICYQTYIISKCNCSDMSLYFLDVKSSNANLTGCVSKNDITCLTEKDLEFYNGDQVDNCYSMCPIECNQIVYDTQVSTADYPSYWYSNTLNSSNSKFDYYSKFNDGTNTYEGPTYDILKTTTVMLNVFYDTMAYSIIQESPSLTSDTLIANIGGNLGLFTGASMLSVIELVELILAMIFIVYTYKKAKKS